MSKAKAGEKKGLVPRLQFPDFQDAGEWDVHSLEDLEKCGWLELGRGNVISANDMRNTPGPYPVYSSSVKTDGYMGSYGQFMFDEELISWSVDGGGDFFYRPRHKFSVTNVSGYMRLKTDCLLYRFVASQLQSLHVAQKFDYQLKAHPSVIRKLYKLGLPSVEEQQKIADCLSSLDTLIAAQTEKIDALKTHKKGLMQQLFPCEGETVPRMRFLEFRYADVWVEQKLEDITKRGSGHTPNKKISSYYNGGVKWVSLADSDKLDHGYLYQTKYEISEDGLKNSSAVLHSSNTVILSRDAGVGKSAVLYSPMAVSQHFIAWQCDIAKLSYWFLYYVLQKLKPVFESIAVGNTIKTIGLPYFKEMKIHVPHVKEQQIIADCLSSLDSLIALQTEKLSCLKLHKKGLMQGLFPPANEVES